MFKMEYITKEKLESELDFYKKWKEDARLKYEKCVACIGLLQNLRGGLCTPVKPKIVKLCSFTNNTNGIFTRESLAKNLEEVEKSYGSDKCVRLQLTEKPILIVKPTPKEFIVYWEE